MFPSIELFITDFVNFLVVIVANHAYIRDKIIICIIYIILNTMITHKQIITLAAVAVAVAGL